MVQSQAGGQDRLLKQWLSLQVTENWSDRKIIQVWNDIRLHYFITNSKVHKVYEKFWYNILWTCYSIFPYNKVANARKGISGQSYSKRWTQGHNICLVYAFDCSEAVSKLKTRIECVSYYSQRAKLLSLCRYVTQTVCYLEMSLFHHLAKMISFVLPKKGIWRLVFIHFEGFKVSGSFIRTETKIVVSELLSWAQALLFWGRLQFKLNKVK